MSWAARRRFYILGGLLVVIAALIALALIAAFYKVPSCTDTIQNQGEVGIDCGGPCPYLCSAQVQAPVVQFARALSPQEGRTDVIAYVENQNTDAVVRDAKYRIDLYGTDNVIVATAVGTVDLPPHTTVPVFMPNFFSGNQQVAHAFLTFDTASLKWQTYNEARTLPKTASADLVGASSTPRIVAVINNADVNPVFNLKAIAVVFDASGNAIGASQTILPQVTQQGSATAIFTWNNPFPEDVARIEVTPIVPLPR